MTDTFDTLDDELRARLASIRLLALDVDGVLTDGRVVHAEVGEIVVFDVHDGQALRWLQEAGVVVAWITGRGCPATARRARELGVEEYHARSGEKGAVLRDVQKRLDLTPAVTAAMGDDLPDLALGANAAVFAAPANARGEVRARAQLVTRATGGRGAVRELIQHLLRAKGLWEPLVARYAK